MFQPHADLVTPSDAASIWRYLDLPKALSMLSTKTLHFARTSELGDPYEGVLPHALIAAREASHATQIAAMSERYDVRMAMEPDSMRKERLRTEKDVFLRAQDAILFGQHMRWRQTAVLCWHLSASESDAMWRVYGSEAGLAIKSTVGRLKESINAVDLPVFIGQVAYLDYDDPTLATRAGWNSDLVPLFWKRDHFSHERELRCALYDGGIGPISAKLVRFPGIAVPVDLETLVEAVYVAPTAPAWFRESVEALFGRFEVPRPVSRSRLDAPHGWAGGGGADGRTGVLR